jgi:hypothetical protein
MARMINTEAKGYTGIVPGTLDTLGTFLRGHESWKKSRRFNEEERKRIKVERDRQVQQVMEQYIRTARLGSEDQDVFKGEVQEAIAGGEGSSRALAAINQYSKKHPGSMEFETMPGEAKTGIGAAIEYGSHILNPDSAENVRQNIATRGDHLTTLATINNDKRDDINTAITNDIALLTAQKELEVTKQKGQTATMEYNDMVEEIKQRKFERKVNEDEFKEKQKQKKKAEHMMTRPVNYIKNLVTDLGLKYDADTKSILAGGPGTENSLPHLIRISEHLDQIPSDYDGVDGISVEDIRAAFEMGKYSFRDLSVMLKEFYAASKRSTQVIEGDVESLYDKFLGEVTDESRADGSRNLEALQTHLNTLPNAWNTNQKETLARAKHYRKAIMRSQQLYDFLQRQKENWELSRMGSGGADQKMQNAKMNMAAVNQDMNERGRNYTTLERWQEITSRVPNDFADAIEGLVDLREYNILSMLTDTNHPRYIDDERISFAFQTISSDWKNSLNDGSIVGVTYKSQRNILIGVAEMLIAQRELLDPKFRDENLEVARITEENKELMKENIAVKDRINTILDTKAEVPSGGTPLPAPPGRRLGHTALQQDVDKGPPPEWIKDIGSPFSMLGGDWTTQGEIDKKKREGTWKGIPYETSAEVDRRMKMLEEESNKYNYDKRPIK